MNGRTYPMVGETANVPFTSNVTPTSILSERVQILEGGYTTNEKLCVFNMKLKGLKTSSGSPSILSYLPQPVTEASLSCIDITSGISTAITNSIPCGVGKNGIMYVQTLTTDSIYAITGVYLIA